jgi:hypothetical protein
MDLPRLLAQLDDTLLGELFSASSLSRARAYVGRVRHIEMAGNQLQAQVQGTEPVPYRVSVRIERREFFGQGSIELATRCTCPVGNRCKHAAALILAARRPGALVDKPRAEILAWARSLRDRIDKVGKAKKAATPKEAIFYLCSVISLPTGDELEFSLLKARVGADGGLTSLAGEWSNYEQALLRPPAFVRDDDLNVFRLLREANRRTGGYGWPHLHGSAGLALLDAAVATGRAYLEADGSGHVRALRGGASRPGTLEWVPGANGVKARVATEPPTTLVVRTEPLAYLDVAGGEVGRVLLDDSTVIAELLALPALAPAELPVIANALADVAPGLPSPQGQRAAELPLLKLPCQPVLSLTSLFCWSWRKHRGYEADFGGHEYDVATPVFTYGEARFEPGATSELASLPDGRAIRVQRDLVAEESAWKAFLAAGFQPLKRGWLISPGTVTEGLYGLESEAHWIHFFSIVAPVLRVAGWHIDCPKDFRHRVLVASGWEVQIEESDEGWFELSLGVEVDGRRVDLAPMLHAVFRQDARWLDPKQIDSIPDDAQVMVQLDDGDRVALAAERVKPIARNLVDLFDTPSSTLKVSRFDAPRLAEVLGDGWRAEGLASLEAWIERIRGAGKIKAVAAPKGFALDLRPYQLDGLAWLQYLREARAGRHPRRRHGPGQDRPDPGPPAHREAWPDAWAAEPWWCCPPP